jgi:hypothetical protein
MRIPMAALIVSLFALGVQPGIAEETGWRDKEGNRVPDSPSRKSSKGFAANLVLTPDADWKEKWERPETPHFNTTEHVKTGDRVAALLFFAGAGRDADGKSKVLCDIKLTRPDGSISMDEKDLVCAEGKIEGPPNNTHLANATPGFVGEPNDMPGTWVFSIRMTDVVRDASVELEQKFVYEKK